MSISIDEILERFLKAGTHLYLFLSNKVKPDA